MRSLGIIPARGGSKGVPRKNVRLLGGKPLIAHSIDAAKGSQLDAYIVSTDDDEIAAVSEQFRARVLRRPPELANDTTPMLSVVLHVLNTLETKGEQFDAMVLLQPTAPLRTSADIDACLKLLQETGCDSVVSVVLVPGHYHPDWQFVDDDGRLSLYNGRGWDELVTRRQLLTPTYTRNGAIYACRVELVMNQITLYGGDVRAYSMPENRSANIDEESDFALAETLFRHTRSHI